jgi:hypothetical protein
LQIDFKDTTVRFALDFVDLTNLAGAQNFVMPDGKLYTGAGRNEGYYPKGEPLFNLTRPQERY